jgi:gluconolactonase
LRLDPALDALVSPGTKVELVKRGFGFTEGPVWVQKGKQGYLLFTDMPSTNGLAFSPDEKYRYVNASRDNYISNMPVSGRGCD